MLNRQLDSDVIPEYVVAYVLYHEMLHLKHPDEIRALPQGIAFAGIPAEGKSIRRLRPRDEISRAVSARLRHTQKPQALGKT